MTAILEPIGLGWIHAALFDLGIYPAAVPADDASVFGEVHRMIDAETVLTVLDEIEGYTPGSPDSSLYRRVAVPVTLEDGDVLRAWVYSTTPRSARPSASSRATTSAT